MGTRTRETEYGRLSLACHSAAARTSAATRTAKTAAVVAWRCRSGIAVARHVRSSCLFSRTRRHRDPCGSRRRRCRARVVDLLQPCAVVGAYRCGGHRDRRRGGHFTSRSRVHCERDDGIHVVRLCRTGPEPRARRVGSGEPASLRTQRDAPQWPAQSSWDAQR